MIIVPVNQSDKVQVDVAERIYSELISEGIEVLIDDRDERPGVKFKDADLIGIPLRITVGRKAGDGIVEYKLRKSKDIREVKVDDILNEVKTTLLENSID